VTVGAGDSKRSFAQDREIWLARTGPIQFQRRILASLGRAIVQWPHEAAGMCARSWSRNPRDPRPGDRPPYSNFTIEESEAEWFGGEVSQISFPPCHNIALGQLSGFSKV
jgi:hypothetical protein